MKLLVFAHKPPPHHGQSYMVQLMLDGFGGDRRRSNASDGSRPDGAAEGIECYHVDCRFSEGFEELGRVRWRKLCRVFRYCAEAIWCRFRYGVRNFYYVPAPGLRAPLYRDWIVMLLCRPFFRRIIFHWHAAGLGQWLTDTARPWERWLSRRLLGGADLSIVLSESNDPALTILKPQAGRALHYGIPDPCPSFDSSVLPRRRARTAAQSRLFDGETPVAAEGDQAGSDPEIFHLLFVSLCTREKGLFDTLEAVARINHLLTEQGRGLRVKLSVGGGFLNEAERAEFDERCARPDLQLAPATPAVEYCGFVAGADKQRLFSESDAFCFPTYYLAESFGLVLVEAMAFGLPVITTRWRAVPELFPKDYPGLVDPRSPDQIAAALENLLHEDEWPSLRAHFLEHYTEAKYLARLAALLRQVGEK